MCNTLDLKVMGKCMADVERDQRMIERDPAYYVSGIPVYGPGITLDCSPMPLFGEGSGVATPYHYKPMTDEEFLDTLRRRSRAAGEIARRYGRQAKMREKLYEYAVVYHGKPNKAQVDDNVRVRATLIVPI